MSRLRELLRADTAGDPMGQRGLWTDLRLEAISDQLKQLGLAVSPHTVRRLLGGLDYTLYTDRKSLSGRQSPERDRQFRYIKRQRQRFPQRGWPVISVDSKKKELVGPFKNPGRLWGQQPPSVNDHDFPSLAQGVALPRGLYDLQANRGWVVVGTSHDTPEFAVEAIVDWWRAEGQKRYAKAPELLILADSGGSNGCRSRLWKWRLQHQLVNPYHLIVTVCHYPTGASKWNPVEHRLFSEIAKHWAGQPLVDYPTVLHLIGGTRTKTGLRVTGHLNPTYYATGRKVSNAQMRQLNLQRHRILPQWNYTLRPTQNRN